MKGHKKNIGRMELSLFTMIYSLADKIILHQAKILADAAL